MLFHGRFSRFGPRLRRGHRAVRTLGVPHRRDRADLPGRSEGCDGQRGRLARGAAAALLRARRGGDDRRLFPRRRAVRRRPRPAAGRVERGAAAVGRVRLPGDPRRHGSLGGQRVEGLLQYGHAAEPCGRQSALFVPLDARPRRELRGGLSFLRRTDPGGPFRAAAWQYGARGGDAARAPQAAAQYRAGDPREFRLDGHGGRDRRAAGHAPHAAAEARGGLVREFLCQFVPHGPGRGGHPERVSGPDEGLDHEDACQMRRTALAGAFAGARGLFVVLRLRRRPEFHQPVLLHVRYGVAGADLAERAAVRRRPLEMGIRRCRDVRLFRRRGDRPQRLVRGAVPRRAADAEQPHSLRRALC